MRFAMFRPLHGWRAFAGEIGVVTLGVLIALVAQQLAQEIDWRNRAGDARAALRRELARHYNHALEQRAVEPCVAAQLDGIERRLLAAGDRLVPAPLFAEDDFRFAVRVPKREMVAAVWEGAVAEGVSSHLRAEERALLGLQYAQAIEWAGISQQLDDAASRLYVAARPLPLDPAARLALLTRVAEARNANALLGTDSGQIIGNIARLDMVPAPAERGAWLAKSGTWRFCRARGLPLRSLTDAQRTPAD